MAGAEHNFGKIIVTALISYVATNADDLIVLMNFYTEAATGNSNLKVRHIVLGQYIGFFILLLISLIGYAVAFVLPTEVLGFLGFVPIFLGIRELIKLMISLYRHRHGTIDDILPSEPVSTVQLQMVRYHREIDGEVAFEIKKASEQPVQIMEPVILSTLGRIKVQSLKYLNLVLTIETLKVISITVANSADNIAIYTPLFAQASRWQIVLYIFIFLLMVLVWLVLAYYFINYQPVLSLAQRYARYIVPIVFIGIGIYIVVSSDCFPWLVKAIQTRNFHNG
jgi:cadmium resistance protein CadD (predicted permease)